MDELDKKIGTKEATRLSAGLVTVQSVTIDVPKEGSKAKLVKLHCKHPDRVEPIPISTIKVKKVQGNNETLKIETLWWNVDEDGNIRKTSAVATLLSTYSKNSLREFVGSDLFTELDSQGYLTIKAY